MRVATEILCDKWLKLKLPDRRKIQRAVQNAPQLSFAEKADMETVWLELCHHLRDDNRGRITAPDAFAQSLLENATTSLGEILRLLGPQLERVRFVT